MFSMPSKPGESWGKSLGELIIIIIIIIIYLPTDVSRTLKDTYKNIKI